MRKRNTNSGEKKLHREDVKVGGRMREFVCFLSSLPAARRDSSEKKNWFRCPLLKTIFLQKCVPYGPVYHYYLRDH